ncbi:MAG: ABC transporter substrate-binding protein/permease [Kofleriaceae bacterium]
MRARSIGLLYPLIVVACSASGPPPGHTLDDIQQRGEITWGADQAGGEPYVYQDDKGNLIGFEVDIANAVARRLGVKARMVQYNWSNLIQSLERGDFDIAMNGIEATQERKDRILLSDPYYVYAETLTVRTDSDAKSLFDLAGKKVGTLNQTFAHDIINMIPTLREVLYEGNEEPYIDLETGRSDAVLLDNIIADRYGCTDKHPTLKCVPYDIARGTYVVGIRKGDASLQAAINKALADMRKDGELQAILEKAKLWDDRQNTATSIGKAEAKRRTFDAAMLVQFLWASLITLKLTFLAFAIAVPLGLLLAIARVYGDPISRTAARAYIELFRGTPVLLQLFVLYYGIANVIHFSPVEAAVLGLGLNYGAYEAEVYRGALLAIPRGQTEAAKALGMRPRQILRYVLVPQALRLALPPMTNDFVSLLKDSSLVSVITVIELTKQMQIAAADLRSWFIPGVACAAFYLLLSFPLSELARWLERRLGGDHRPHTL